MQLIIGIKIVRGNGSAPQVVGMSSSMALSVYSPENLASLLEDKVEMTREEKIAYFKAQQQSVN